MAYRRKAIRLGKESRQAAQELWIRCARDPLYWLNVFGWTYRPGMPGTAPAYVPFITWESYQDATICELLERISLGGDVGIDKSRDMGATWMVLAAFAHVFMFARDRALLLVSRKAEMVEKTGDKKTLMWKFDTLIDKQPDWMKPPTDSAYLHRENLNTGTSVDGESTTEDTARADRRTAVYVDELASIPTGDQLLASIADVSPCRIFTSTPKGRGNAFYRVMHELGVTRISLHWTKHPEKAAGLYYLGGKPRSPWYDKECKRRANAREVAQELDIDYSSSDYQFFESEMVDALMSKHVTRPLQRGDVELDEVKGEIVRWQDAERGPWKLWVALDAQGLPPQNRMYGVGVDVSMGVGASDSVLSVVDRQTGEKVAEYVNNRILPEKLATLAVAVCAWFRGLDESAFLAWEDNGPGSIFRNRVLTLGFRNFYYRNSDVTTQLAGGRTTQQAGWHSSPETKVSLLGDYRTALANGRFINHSWEALEELRRYVAVPGSRVAHSSSRSTATSDPFAQGDNHGDRVIADAVAHLTLFSSEVQSVTAQQVPPNSFAGRRERRRQLQSAEGSRIRNGNLVTKRVRRSA